MGSPTVKPYLDFYGVSELFTEEQRLVEQATREFVKKELSPSIGQHYIDEKFPESKILQFGSLGLLGGNLHGYGLPGMDHISYGLVMKELERCDSGIRSFASVQGALVMFPIYEYGSEEQKKEWGGYHVKNLEKCAFSEWCMDYAHSCPSLCAGYGNTSQRRVCI